MSQDLQKLQKKNLAKTNTKEEPVEVENDAAKVGAEENEESELAEVESAVEEEEKNSSDSESTKNSPKKKRSRKKTNGLPLASVKRIILVGGSGVNLGKKKTSEGKQSSEDSKLRVSSSVVKYIKDIAEHWIDILTVQSTLFMKVSKRKVLQIEDLEAAIQTKYPGYDTTKLKIAHSKDNFDLYRKKGLKMGGSKPALYLPTASVRKVIKSRAGNTKVRSGYKIGMQYFIEQKILECALVAAKLTAEKNKKTIEVNTIMFVMEHTIGN